MRKLCFLILFLILCLTTTYAQLIVKGVVTDKDDGLPLPQVFVTIKGTGTESKTNLKGEFTIELKDENQELEFRYLGYQSKTIRPKFNELNRIVLRPDCTGGRARPPYIQVAPTFDILNNDLGGELELQLPYPANRAKLKVSRLILGSESKVDQLSLKVVDIGDYCVFHFTTELRYERWNITNELNIQAQVITFSTKLIGNSKIHFGYGFGRNYNNENQKLNIYEIGLSTSSGIRISNYPIRNYSVIWLPFKIKTAYSQAYWDHQITTSLYVKSYEFELGYRRIARYNQLLLSLGINLRLVKKVEY